MTAFLTIFRRFLKIFQNCSEGHTNIPHTFSEDFQRLPKTLRGRPEDVFIIHERIWVQFKRQVDINEIIHIFTIEDVENTSLESRMLFRMNFTCGVFSSKTPVSKINKVKIAFVEKYTLISWFLANLGVQNDVRKSACVIFFGSVQKISRLDSQSKFQMITLFTGRHIGRPIFMETTGNE